MPPLLNTLAVEIAGMVAIWSATTDIKTGKAATNKAWTIDFADNKVGFCLLVIFKAGFACFAVAYLLYALDLTGNPTTAIKNVISFPKV
jgi:hypothetical protein